MDYGRDFTGSVHGQDEYVALGARVALRQVITQIFAIRREEHLADALPVDRFHRAQRAVVNRDQPDLAGTVSSKYVDSDPFAVGRPVRRQEIIDVRIVIQPPWVRIAGEAGESQFSLV